MALIACHECKNPVSSEAPACPHCGAKPRKPAKGISPLAFIAVVVAGYAVFALALNGAADSTGNRPAKSTADAQADKELNLAIAAGSVLKKYAKDPSSFKMESFLIFPGGATCYEYRAKNSFGAIVPGKAVFEPPGTMLTSGSDGKTFVKSWNAVCTRAGGQERAGGLNLLGVW